jgi:hypothetical protein
MLAAPLGAPNAAVVAEAVFEHWADLAQDERLAYRRDPGVRAELREAADRSIFSPQWRPGRDWVYAMNMFALAFCITYQYAEAQRCFLAIGPYADEYVWNGVSGAPAEAFVEWRDLAFREGAAR